MRQSILRVIGCAGAFTAAALFFNGVTFNPVAGADGNAIDAPMPVPSSSQSLLDTKKSDPSIKAAVAENYGRLPLSFEANNGQVDEAVKFLSRGNGYTLFLTASEVVLSFRRGSIKKDEQQALRKNPDAVQPKQVENEEIRLKNIGANPNPEVTGMDELPGKSHYFIGDDPAKWRTNVSNYAKVKVRNVYSGIDLVYYGNQQQLEYDWIVAPGADPKAIRFAVEGKSDPRIDSQGNLILDEKGELCLKKPLIYQERDGDLMEIAGRYVVLNNRKVHIEVGEYDAALPLVIDPVLSYFTYLGGEYRDEGLGIAVDSSGNAYVAGSTVSTNFPTANPFQASHGGGNSDAFVTKLNAAGDTLVYSTFFGGNRDEYAKGIRVDAFGNAYVTGETRSGNFPTASPFQAGSGGYADAFVAKLDASGSALVYSTYLGGEDIERANGLAIDASGNAYVTGETWSTNFPTANPFQASFGGGNYDAFAAKVNASGSALVYSTYLGGSNYDWGNGIDVDTSGNAYVTGTTYSPDFPTANPFQESNSGGADAFVTRLSISGNALVYSTFLGGSSNDGGGGIAVDTSGNAYLTGSTESAGFPTVNPFQESNSGGADAFVTKLNAAGKALIYSTYLGGSFSDWGSGIAVDTSGNAYVTGIAWSSNFPTVNPFQESNSGGAAAFVAKLEASGSALIYSSYLGEKYHVFANGVAIDSSGHVYIVGTTQSGDFPNIDPLHDDSDAFVAKIGPLSDFLRRGIQKRTRNRLVR